MGAFLRIGVGLSAALHLFHLLFPEGVTDSEGRGGEQWDLFEHLRTYRHLSIVLPPLGPFPYLPFQVGLPASWPWPLDQLR